MEKHFPKALSIVGIVVVIISIFGPNSAIGRSLFESLREFPYARRILLICGLILASTYFWKTVFAFAARKLGKIPTRTKEITFAVLVLAGLLAFFYRDVVFQGKTFLMENMTAGTMPEPPGGPFRYPYESPGPAVFDPGAIAWQIEPFNRFVSTSIKKGDFPLWNPYAGPAGSPLLADAQTGPLEPIQFLLFFVPTVLWPYAIDFQLLIRYLIAGLGCYLFARRQKLDFVSGISAAIVFVFSSYFVGYGDHPKVKVLLLLPLVLYGYDRLTDRKDKLGFWLCGLLVGWSILAAMPEGIFFALFLGTLWFFYKSIANADKSRLAAGFMDMVGRYIVSTVMGFLISAPFLLPMLEYIRISANYHAVGTGGLLSLWPFWLYPNLIFRPQTGAYLGLFPLFALVYSLLNVNHWPEHRSEILFYGGFAVFFLSVLFHIPVFSWFVGLPILNQINIVDFATPPVIWCIAMLTATSIDAAKNHEPSIGNVLIAFAILLLVFVAPPILASPAHSIVQYVGDQAQLIALAFMMGGICLSILLLVLLRHAHKIHPLVLQIGLVGLLVIQVFLGREDVQRPSRFDPFQAPPFVQYLQHVKGAFRILGLDRILYPNTSTAYGLSDIRWLNGLEPKRGYDFSTQFVAPDNFIRFAGDKYPISDRMFNLLNVKYVLIRNSGDKNTNTVNNPACPAASGAQTNDQIQHYFGENTLANLILSQNPSDKNLAVEPLNISGDVEMALYAPADEDFNLKLSVPATPSNLHFSIGLSPQVFRPDRGDGVDFQISVVDGNHEVDVFRQYLDPKKNPCDRYWFEESVNLQNWAGRQVVLKFTTGGGPAGDTAWDWAYWGDIHLESADQNELPAASSATDYRLVHTDKYVQIYENRNVFPRAFMVYNIHNVSTPAAALQLLADPKLDLKQTAVVENLPADLETVIKRNDPGMQSVPGIAKLISSGELDVEADTKAPGLLVVSDQYYPGWQAIVDGKPAAIFAVDESFRGVFLNAGSHTVKFIYRPLSFIVGGAVSVVSLLTAVIFLIRNARRPRKPRQASMGNDRLLNDGGSS